MRLGIVALGGALLGWVGALTSSPLWLAPWGLAAVAVGVFAGSSRRAALSGGCLGFAIAYVFMLASYDGSASLASRFVPFLAFGVVGAFCAGLLALTAAALSRARRRPPSDR